MSNRYIGASVQIPAGSLNVWRAARSQTASQSVDVLVASDSTGFGQTPSGAGFEAPWPYKLRASFLGAGSTDGGRGLVGLKNETSASSGEALVSVTATSGFAAAGGSTDMLANYNYVSSTPGDTITFTGKGTKARIFSTQAGTNNGGFTYSVDGGGAVTVTADNTKGEGLTAIDLGADATHTLMITNAGTGAGYVGVCVDFYRATGLVIHNWSIPGMTSGLTGHTLNGSENWPGYIEAASGLVRSSSTSTAEYNRAAEGGNARRLKLAIFALGINDQQGNSSDNSANVKNGAQKFCRLARAAGADPLLIVQHYEGAAQNQNAALYRAAIYAAGKAENSAVVDFSQSVLGPVASWVANGYINVIGNPHLTDAGYTLQAARLFDVLSNY